MRKNQTNNLYRGHRCHHRVRVVVVVTLPSSDSVESFLCFGLSLVVVVVVVVVVAVVVVGWHLNNTAEATSLATMMMTTILPRLIMDTKVVLLATTMATQTISSGAWNVIENVENRSRLFPAGGSITTTTKAILFREEDARHTHRHHNSSNNDGESSNTKSQSQG